jgi:ATP-binding cassette subfamily F protein uup
VLVMDEPTNDLDAETLELLEELLLEYAGTLLLVSHDRAFLDNVVTSTLVFEGEGRVTEYTGGYEDWIRQRAAKLTHFREIPAEPKPEPKPAPAIEKGAKFLKKEQRELEELPEQIEKMETEVSALNEKMWDPELYKKEPGKLPVLKAELAVLEERIKHGYTRWEQLEAKRKASEFVVDQPPG